MVRVTLAALLLGLPTLPALGGPPPIPLAAEAAYTAPLGGLCPPRGSRPGGSHGVGAVAAFGATVWLGRRRRPTH